MQSRETFRKKLNNFVDVHLVCDDGLVTKELAVHFFIDILFFIFRVWYTRDKQSHTTVALQWHYSGTAVALQWHYSDTTVTLQ